MRNCPECGARTISNFKLVFQELVPGLVAACTKCHTMVGFECHDRLLALVLAEWVLLGLITLSFLYFGNLWMGLAIFVAWRLTRLYFKLKKPLVISE